MAVPGRSTGDLRGASRVLCQTTKAIETRAYATGELVLLGPGSGGAAPLQPRQVAWSVADVD